MNIEETLQQFISDQFADDRADSHLGVDDNLLISGLIDSLGVMRLVNFVEDTFGIGVPPEDVTIEHFRSIRVIAEYIERRVTAVAAQD